VIVGGTDVTYDSTRIAGTAAGKDNIIAPRVYARGDLRFISQDQLLKARDAMRAIVADHLPGTIATITFEDGNPAMPPTRGNLAVLAVEDSVSRALGQGAVDRSTRASAEEETFPTSRLTWTRSMDSA